MHKNDLPPFAQLFHITPDLPELLKAYEGLKDRKNESSDFRFAEIRPELAQQFPFDVQGYDYVSLTDIAPELKNTAIKASPREMYKMALRGQAPALDDRNYKHFREDVPKSLVDFTRQFKGEVSRVRFATLKARNTIYEHIDNNVHHTIRIHIPLITDPRAVFGVRQNNQLHTLHMEAGSVWFLNTALSHCVVNSSPVDRVHLIVNLSSLDDLKLALEPELTRNPAA